MKISILLAAYKSQDLLNRVFIPSLKNCTYDVEVVLYDNGGNDQVDIENVKSNVEIFKIGDGKNIGLNAALNKCYEFATGDWFFLPHTDMHLLPRWDMSLIDAAKKYPPTALLLCSRSIEKHSHIQEQLLQDFGTDLDSFKEKELYDFFSTYHDKSIVTGKRMPFFLHRKLWEKLGGVDENYFSYCTDDDLIQDCYDKGVRRFWMVFGSVVYHLSGHSNKQQAIDRDSNLPYEYFVKKWKDRGYRDACHPARWHNVLIPNGIKIK